MRAKTKERLGDCASYLFFIVTFIFFAAPLTWLLSLALRDRREIFLGVARYIPENPTLENFTTVLTNSYFPSYLWNGLFLSAMSALGVIVICLPAAYAFSRYHFSGKGAYMLGLLLFQMISPMVIMVPLYRYMNVLGLLDTHFAVIVVYIALGVPIATWLLKARVDRIPKALDEAALIDGCTRFSVFWRIIFPLAAPGTASVFIITVIAGWSQFLVPFLLLTSDHLQPIGVGIFTFRGTQNASTIQLLAAACLIAVVPAIIVFLALQRAILGAMTSGAIKG